MKTEAKLKELESNPEFQAIKEIQGIDSKRLMEDAGFTADPNKEKTDENVAGGEPNKNNPPITEKTNTELPNTEATILKEIFGDRFATIEEVKKANITSTLAEVEDLRRVKADLELKLGSKPKSSFANDEVALYNEFVKETGLKSYGLFQKINGLELATMDPMEALVTKFIIDNPNQAGREAQVKQHLERRYNVDPTQVDEDDLAINKIGMEADGATALKFLQGIKEKLKVPEVVEESQKPRELTPVEKEALKTGWSSVGEKVSESLSKLKVPIKNSKESLLDYEISESEQKEITAFVAGYAVENKMELNETNVRMVSTMVYNQLMLNKLPEIVHSVFEKARSMTEQQVHALYENPSITKNGDRPSVAHTQNEDEKRQDAAFQAEMGR